VRALKVSLRKNVVANYVGQGWRVVMALAFVPLYIRYLGIEAYGLIGIFAMLQSWLALLDMGMKPALGREMARFTGGVHDAQSIGDLLRSIEIIALAIAVLITIAVWAASGWLASDWVTAERLPVASVAQAIALMGLVTALHFIESVYTSSIAGLQRQVVQNVVGSIMATARGVGAVGILVWVSPTISAFFVWQGIISLATVAVTAAVVYRVLPQPPRPARFSMPALLGIWRYAAGMMGITVLALLLTQVDKVLLSRLLSLEAFAYYALAGVVTTVLPRLTGPITSAFYPRFTELAARNDVGALRAVYHQGAQLVSVLMGAAAIVLMVMGDRALLLWTSDAELTRHVAPLLTVLTLGTLLNALMWIPYQLQLAHGWTSLTVKVNSVAVAILVPAIIWAVPHYGAIGAAWIWVTLNAGYILFAIYFMHLRLLPTEKWRWYRQDVAVPLAAAAAAAWLCRWALPRDPGRLGEFAVLLLSGGSAVLAAALAAPLVRAQLVRYLPGGIRRFTLRTMNHSR
jgi:O-antigen/teichoic acid export membrane protein